jgi:hypothetical protein
VAEGIVAAGDRRSGLVEVVDFELFRPDLEAGDEKTIKPGNGGVWVIERLTVRTLAMTIDPTKSSYRRESGC